MNDDELIYQIYNTLYEPDSWKDTLANVARALDSSHIFLLARNHATSQPFAFIETGFADGYFQQYQEYYYQHDIWTQSLIGHSENQFHASHEVCDDQRYLHSEIYNDFAGIENIRHSMGCLITNPSQEMFAELGLMRGREQAHYDALTRARADTLVKHFQQSLSIAQRLQASHIGIEAFQQLLELQKEDVFICDTDGRLLQHNSAAEKRIRQGNVLKILSSNTLVFIDIDAQNKFEYGLSQLRNINSDYGFLVQQPAGIFKVRLQPWVHSHITPLGSVRTSAVMVSIRQLRSSVVLAPEELTAHYQLTRAEAEIVQALCRGASLQEIAELRQASIHTVRQQVKTCLQKTHCRSQAELVSTVLMQHLN